VEPLDLAGGGAASGLGQQVLNAVFAADPVQQHLHRRMGEPAGEAGTLLSTALHAEYVGLFPTQQSRRLTR